MDERVQDIIEALQDLANDNTVPRNIKNKVEEVIDILQEDGADISIRIDKALTELDEISEDVNLQAYARTQIWNISSMLEML